MLKLAFVVQRGGHAGKEDRDVAVLDGAIRAGFRVADDSLAVADHLVDALCGQLGLRLLGAVGGIDRFFGRGVGKENFDTGRLGRIGAVADGGCIVHQQLAKQIVDEGSAFRVGAEGDIEVHLAVVTEAATEFGKALDLCAAEAVDALFGVADEEEFFRIEFPRVIAQGGQQKVQLRGVGVLCFVDEQLAYARGEGVTQVFALGEKIAGVEDQVVEVQ